MLEEDISIRKDLMCLIVLAAGFSKRFGRNKLLEQINGLPVIQRVVRSAIDSKADEVVVVLGYEAEVIRETLKGLECKFAYNENFKLGQSSSVKVGLLCVIGYARALIVLPGDIALITPKAINMVIEEYIRSKGSIVVASQRGKVGHPILFDCALFDEVMNISEETMGLRAVVNRHIDSIRKVEVGSDEVVLDFDTEEDFKRLLKHIRPRK